MTDHELLIGVSVICVIGWVIVFIIEQKVADLKFRLGLLEDSFKWEKEFTEKRFNNASEILDIKTRR